MDNAEREKHDRFLRLYVENEESLNGFVRSLVFTLDDAREVMQDTAVVLWRKFEELDSPEDFRRWAFGVDRARDRHVFSDDLISMLEKEAAEAGEKSSQEELALQECLTKLPSKHRKLVQAVYMGGERIDKIADKAGRTPMSLYKSLHRIRMSLADCINKHLSQQKGTA